MIDRELIIKQLREAELVVDFTKKNGDKRRMTCTLRHDLIPPEAQPKGTGKGKKPIEEQTSISVFDTEAGAWRGFIWDNVNQIQTLDEAKQGLIDKIKRPTRYYRITMSGAGGEIVYGKISPDAYEYWNMNEKALDDYVLDQYEDQEKPSIPGNADFLVNYADDQQYHDRKEWYECDDLVHDNGVEYNNAQLQIDEVEDDTWNAQVIKELWTGTLDDFIKAQADKPKLNNNKCECKNIDHEHIFGVDPPYTFYGMSVEKGEFFNALICTEGELDTHGLVFHSTSYPNGDQIVSQVTYTGTELDNEGGDTRGKSFHFHVEEW